MNGRNALIRLKTKLTSICRAYGIETLYVFGSRADEIQAAVSGGSPVDHAAIADVDVAAKIVPNHRLSVRQMAQLAIALEDWLNVGRIDLVNLADADPFLAANIIRGVRLYCTDNYLADEYELYILRRAGDLAPFERQRQKMILNR